MAACALIGEPDQQLWDKVLAYAREQNWEEVIKLAIAHEKLAPKRRNLLVEKMLESSHLLLAGQGVRDAGRRAPTPLRDLVMEQLAERMVDGDVAPPERFACGALLIIFRVVARVFTEPLLGQRT